MKKTDAIIEKVRKNDLLSLPLGRYELDDGSYYLVQEYLSMDESECRLEAHRRFVDVQMVIKGEEVIKTCSLDNLEIEEEYSESKDVIFFKSPKEMKENLLRDGEYLILYPEDAHKPGVSYKEKPTSEKSSSR